MPELRALEAFKADARGVECGAVTFVQRFGGSLNLNVHFHVVVLDGVFTRGVRADDRRARGDRRSRA